MASNKYLYAQSPWSIIRSNVYLYFVKSTKNPWWLLMFVVGRFQVVRCLITYLYKLSQIESPKLDYVSHFPELRVNKVVEVLEKDGIYLGLKLPESILQEILTFAHNTYCYGDGKDDYGFFYREKSAAEKLYGQKFIRSEYHKQVLSCPAIQELIKDQTILDIATKYLGKKPKFTGCRLHWIFVVKDMEYDLNKGSMNFHYDLNDYRSITFFFYLTDVNLLSGPHICIRGSHKQKKFNYLLSLFRRQTEAELLNYYGAENKLTICGESGFGFIEDVFCFHKATPPISQDRLLLQLRFSLYDYQI